MAVKITRTELDGVLIFEPDRFVDDRGYYCETFSERSLSEAGFTAPRFVQDNQSRSLRRGTIRGIHFQLNPKPQSKLVRCTRGRVFDVVVDLRRDSETFMQWVSVELSDDNGKQIWIPNWCGHGFLTLEDDSVVQYKVDEFYYPDLDRAIRFDDPQVGVAWPIEVVVRSPKDLKAPWLADSDVNFSKASQDLTGSNSPK